MAVCGANPERITFYGGGIALSKSGMESLTDAKRLVILSAGCSVNLLVAAACFAMQGNDTAAVFGAVNLIICIFNALPIGYFDGAEVLELLLYRICIAENRRESEKNYRNGFSVDYNGRSDSILRYVR